MLSHALLCSSNSTARVFLGHVYLGGGVHSVRMCEEQQHKVNNRGGHASGHHSTHHTSAQLQVSYR